MAGSSCASTRWARCVNRMDGLDRSKPSMKNMVCLSMVIHISMEQMDEHGDSYPSKMDEHGDSYPWKMC